MSIESVKEEILSVDKEEFVLNYLLANFPFLKDNPIVVRASSVLAEDFDSILEEFFVGLPSIEYCNCSVTAGALSIREAKSFVIGKIGTDGDGIAFFDRSLLEELQATMSPSPLPSWITD